LDGLDGFDGFDGFDGLDSLDSPTPAERENNLLLAALLRGARDVTQVEAAEVDWLLPQFLHKGGRTLLAGLPGAGKTTWAVELTHALAHGGLFMGERVNKARVCWLTYEHVAGSLRAKLERLGDVPAGCVTVLSGEAALPLNATTVDAYAEFVRRQEIDLIIADTFADWLALDDMDATSPVREAMQLAGELCEATGVAVLGIAHPRKQATLDSVYSLANSYMLAAKAENLAILVDTSRDGRQTAELRVLKNRHGEGAWTAELLKRGGRFLPLAKGERPKSLAELVVEFIQQHGGRAYRSDIITAFQEHGSERRLDRTLARLVDARRLVKGYEPQCNRVAYLVPEDGATEPVFEGVVA
jgi:hypothetical protein